MLRPMTDARAATLPAWPLPAACAALPDRDGRSADDIVGYDDDGLW